MTTIDRRDLLRLALGGLAAAPLSAATSPLRALERAARIGAGRPAVATEKVLLIFLRGAMDGVLAVVPVGDPTYNASRNIGANPPWIDPAVTLPLTAFAGLNPRMGVLTGAGSPWAAQQLAFLHQVGNSTGQRSHFTEMARLETAHVLDAPLLPEDGFVPRLGGPLGWPQPATAIQAASVSGSMQRLFQSTARPQFHLRDVIGFRNKVFPAGLVAHLANTPTAPVERVVDGLGDLMLVAHGELNAAPAPTHDPALFPQAGDPTWPLAGPRSSQYENFFRDLEGALYLLEHTSCCVAGVELGAFDTHADELPLLNNLLEVVAYGIHSAWLAAQQGGISLTTLAMTEFGRTARANGNGGTDHGKGSLMIACGPNVQNGVYNCDAATWPNLGAQALLPTTHPDWNAVPVRTHWLAVFQELIEDLYGITAPAQQNLVLPGLPTIAGQSVATQLGFL